VLNASHAPPLGPLPGSRGTIFLSTHLDHDTEAVSASISLRADEAVMVALG